ncbi:amino acid ABC transporter permease [Teichococcus cervicalis]|uniref:Putative ectoine/hydroxyectoine ABC transporter, permease protein EhuD n=1 Tax=Pseudoroseomonas cervicalis ATCC 49957 TaxID=525371 RepID=D5RK01_9PROT|nr:amino acid ABC transporter permease [Pseudoroseomonas cervicalis]EFH12363.1 putative ectoine/hydroxyectoine ABC transporter, permease protein EhuD [Pseudoroseomonas cervicalis ATCC 49957]
MSFDSFLGSARDFLPILLQGVWVTIGVTLGALVIATLLGLVWALMRTSGTRWLEWPAKAVVNTLRGIPIIVQLFYIYFVLPDLGIDLTAFQAGVIGLGVAYSAYMGEVFRSGMLAVDPGAVEAAESLGLSRLRIMTRVILPQATRIVLPPYGNMLIMMLKDSSQASVITVAEISTQSRMIASSTFKNQEVFTLAALLYLALSVPLIILVGRLEKRFGRR